MATAVEIRNNMDLEDQYVQVNNSMGEVIYLCEGGEFAEAHMMFAQDIKPIIEAIDSYLQQKGQK